MIDPRFRSYQLPTHPLARVGLVLAGIAILALSFVLGLVFLAVAAGLALLGALAMIVRRWFGGVRGKRHDDEVIDVEYRVIKRDQDADD